MRKRKQQEIIYKKAYNSFFGLCVRYTGNVDEAKEVFNDGMIKFFNYEKKNTILEKGRFALIKKILTNCCIDHIRSKKIEFTNIEENSTAALKDQNLGEYNIIRNEMMELIKNFPPQTRLVFNLYIFEGWSHKEIAEHLNITIHTSNWHVNSGKKKILELFVLEN